MNILLSEYFSEKNNYSLVDTLNWIDTDFESREKNWFYTKCVFNIKNAKQISNNILNIVRNKIEAPRKIIFLDLDNTLWGGIVGEEGIDNLKIGGHDPIGEAFQNFQKKLKYLKNRGILLAIVSKNDENVAINCIEKNPDMILKKSDFVKYKINWSDKASNIREILEELNLGASSAIFLDDSIEERERVKFAIPEIYVPDLPIDKTLYPIFLENIFCFNINNLTDEDKNKTELYKQNEERYLNKSKFLKNKTYKDWLKFINSKLKISNIDSLNFNRCLQLLNKTNQFNLQTNRYNDEKLKLWLKLKNNHMFTFKLRDNFGDYGLIGIISFNANNKKIEIVDFILSCRAMSKKVENAMIAFVYEYMKLNNIKTASYKYIKSKKNKPILDFLKSLDPNNNKNLFKFSINKKFNFPKELKISKEK